MPGRWWGPWLLAIAVWTLIGLFFSVQGFRIVTRFHNPEATFTEAIVNTLPDTYVWAAFSPLVVRLGRRLRVERGTWMWAVPVHLLIGCAVALLQTVLAISLFALLWAALGHEVFWSRWVQDHLILFFHWNLVVYAALVAIGSAADYYQEARERERRAAQLEARLAQAQLQALKVQLHPHFLFNALNGIAELIHEDPAAAERMVLGLGGLLRSLLERAASQEITLAQELEFVRAYLAIEQMRFQDRLSVVWEIDPAALPALVPSLVLQPLVENALRHGVAPRAGASRVTVRAARQGESLRLAVADDGPGFRRDARAGIAEGVGLSNTRVRLRQLYGPDGWLELADAEGGGAEAVVVIPYRTATGGGTAESEGGPC